MRELALFLAVAVAHFGLSVVSLAQVLPAAFETQGGNFWAAPGRAVVAWLSGVLLAPLAWGPADFGFLEIGLVSALWGAAAIALARLLRSRAARAANQ